MIAVNRAKFLQTAIPDGVDLHQWELYGDVVLADVAINVPIAKHHLLACLSLGIKNLLGEITKPGQIHTNLGQRVADLASVVRPSLTVIDAVRILMDHGPTGGNLDDVKLTNTIVASRDFVAADAQAATLFGLAGGDISYFRAAAKMGLGTMDLASVVVRDIVI